MPYKVQRYGWIHDLPDQRDYVYAAPVMAMAELPTSVDLRSQCPPVYDQGQLGSCTANAIGGAIQFTQMKEKLAQIFTPSRLFIYYNERDMEGTVDSDSGAQIRDGMKSVAQLGACPETMWPYDIKTFTEKPSAESYTAAAQHEVKNYSRLGQSLVVMKACLASGYPYVFGFTVYESFESPEVARTGDLSMPKPAEQAVGGHAVVAVGYDDAQQKFIVRNSWGTGWGLGGYFLMPYAYLTQASPVLASDFWTIRLV